MSSNSSTDKTFSLPYEVLLNIMDKLIEEAEVTALKDPALFWTRYRQDTKARFVVFDDISTKPACMPLKNRFRNLRLPLQINRQTKAMVARKFSPLPFENNYSESEDDIFYTWSYTKADFFLPYHARQNPKFLPSLHFYNQAALLPTPDGFKFLQTIEKLWMPTPDYFSYNNAASITALATLPNIKSMSVNIGAYTNKVYEEGALHVDPHPIDGEMLPGLILFELFVADLYDMWRPLKEKGVVLYGILEDGKPDDVFAELISTKDRILVKFTHPNCSCNKPCKEVIAEEAD